MTTHSFNRTTMELKYYKNWSRQIEAYSFNRTTMELK